MNKTNISYKTTSKKDMLCENEDSAEFVRKIRVRAYDGNSVIGDLEGYIINIFPLLERGMLYVFDDTSTLARLCSLLYSESPYGLTDDAIRKGLNKDFLSVLSNNFGHNFSKPDEDGGWGWLDHYHLTIGFVDDLNILESYRGMGIGTKMMNELKKFRRTVDYMILQSFPSGISDSVNNLNISFDEKREYRKTPEYKKLFEEGQVAVDRFYTKAGYHSFKSEEHTWMVMDKEGLQNLERKSKIEARDSSPQPF